MGARGSSRWKDHQKADLVEDCKVLDLTRLTHEARPVPGNRGEIAWNDWGREFLVKYRVWLESDGRHLVLEYLRGAEAIKMSVPLVATRTYWGGLRWWGACTLCDNKPGIRRVGKLYLPNGAKYFGCRRCHRLTYESTQMSNTRSERLLMPGLIKFHFRYNINPQRRRWARHSPCSAQ